MIDQPNDQLYTPEQIVQNRDRVSTTISNLRNKLTQIDNEPFNADSPIFVEGIYQGIFVDARKIGYPDNNGANIFEFLKELSRQEISELISKIEEISEYLINDTRYKTILDNLETNYFDASTPDVLTKGFPSEMTDKQLETTLNFTPRLPEDTSLQLKLILGYFAENFIQIDILNTHSGLNLDSNEWRLFFAMLAYDMQNDEETQIVSQEYSEFMKRNNIDDPSQFTFTISEALNEIADTNRAASDSYAKDMYLNVCRNSLQFKLQMLMILN